MIDSSGHVLGTILEVYNCGASDIVTVEESSSPESDNSQTPRRTVELPFVASYFDLDSEEGEGPIRLVVPKETFDEMWQDR